MVTLDQGGRMEDSGAQLSPAPGRLASFVEHGFVVDFRGSAASSWKIVPDMCGHLLVHVDRCGDQLRMTQPVVVGARNESIETDVSDRAWTIGVRFRIGALPGLTGLPAGDFVDRAVGVGDIWGRAGEQFAQEVRTQTDPSGVQRTIVAFIENIAKAAQPPDWRVRKLADLAARSGGSLGVTALADQLGVSARSLRARSSELVGLAPKRLIRIHRLFAALRAAMQSSPPSWSGIAAAQGFSDQPHLVREFRDLLGETPTQYLARGRS